MLFRTRVARPHRALVMIRERDELLKALQAVADGAEHPAVLRNDDPATARRVGYVFPGRAGSGPEWVAATTNRRLPIAARPTGA